MGSLFLSMFSYHNDHLTILSQHLKISRSYHLTSTSTTMASERLPICHPRSKRQTRLLLVLEVLLHSVLAEFIRFILLHLVKTFSQCYWLVLVIPLCAIILDEFLRVWFLKKTKVTGYLSLKANKAANTMTANPQHHW